MNRSEMTTKLEELIVPYVNDEQALKSLTEESELIAHLNISSMHLIDIVLDVEEAFDIEISGDEANEMNSVGNVLDLIEAKRASASEKPEASEQPSEA